MSEIFMGVDVGYGNTKGPTTVIGSGVSKLPMRPPILRNTIEYNDTFYSVGGFKTDIQKSKTMNEDAMISTMAILGKELRKMNLHEAEIRLGVGLPLTRIGAEREDYLNYMKKNKRLDFKFEGSRYSVFIISADVFPQGYSAVISRLNTFGPSAVVVDCGSWTLDVLPLSDGQPDLARCKSLNMGAITAINDINEMLRQKFGEEADEAFIKEVMINGTSNINAEYLAVIQEGLTAYAESIMNTLRSLRFNMTLTHFVFIGGGASIIKNFVKTADYNMTIIEDVNINAKGYVDILRHKYPAA